MTEERPSGTVEEARDWVDANIHTLDPLMETAILRHETVESMRDYLLGFIQGSYNRTNFRRHLLWHFEALVREEASAPLRAEYEKRLRDELEVIHAAALSPAEHREIEESSINIGYLHWRERAEAAEARVAELEAQLAEAILRGDLFERALTEPAAAPKGSE